MSEQRVIRLHMNLVISEDDWTSNFGVEGHTEIVADVRRWAQNLLSGGLAANGVSGVAQLRIPAT